VSQACSIQSLGGNCEAITIGHNPSGLGLTKTDIFIETDRPQFLCERLHGGKNIKMKALRQRQKFNDAPGRRIKHASSFEEDASAHSIDSSSMHPAPSFRESISKMVRRGCGSDHSPGDGSEDAESVDTSTIKAFFLEMRQNSTRRLDISHHSMGRLDISHRLRSSLSPAGLDKSKISTTAESPNTSMHGEEEVTDTPLFEIPHFTGEYIIKDNRGIQQVLPNNEVYFGQAIHASLDKSTEFDAVETQDFAVELYESRIVSLQRFVAMCVMFHQMGKKVEAFFSAVSFGLMGYRIDRTNSIVRVATTASPVSGDAVQERMQELNELRTVRRAAQFIQATFQRKRKTRITAALEKVYEELDHEDTGKEDPDQDECSLPSATDIDNGSEAEVPATSDDQSEEQLSNSRKELLKEKRLKREIEFAAAMAKAKTAPTGQN